MVEAGWAMGSRKREESSFYLLEGTSFVIEFDEVGCVDLIRWFPSIVAFRVALPFDQILELL